VKARSGTMGLRVVVVVLVFSGNMSCALRRVVKILGGIVIISMYFLTMQG
jgi:hypothetical protein